MLTTLSFRMVRVLTLSIALCALVFVPSSAVAQDAAAAKQVMNPAKAPAGPETIELKELWRVGGYDDEEVLFGVITDIITDADGNFYMLDSQLSEVQVYSPDGEYLRTIGREGEGPGEFRGAFNLLLLPSGDIGVLQTFPSKVIGLTPAGDPADDFLLPETEGDVGFKALFQARNAGDQLAVVFILTQPSEAGFTQKNVLSLFDADGENERRLHSQDSSLVVSDPVFAESVWDTFRARWTSGSDGKVYSAIDFGEYKITAWGSDGKISHVINRDYAEHERTEEQSARILGIFQGFTRQIPIPNLRFDIEPKWNPVAALSAREDGTLWVRTSRGNFGLPEDEAARYDVFDNDGKLKRQLILKGQGNPEEDGYFIVGDKLFVVTDWLNSLMALQGGGGTTEDMDEEAEPMEIICYQLP